MIKTTFVCGGNYKSILCDKTTVIDVVNVFYGFRKNETFCDNDSESYSEECHSYIAEKQIKLM